MGQNPGWWHLSDQEGLPGSTIYEIVQDDDGYMWIGTNGGLCRFDGREFKLYENLGFRDNEILELKKDSHNRIWFMNLLGELAYVEKDTIVDFSYGVQEETRVNNYWMTDNGIIIAVLKGNRGKEWFWYEFDNTGQLVLKKSKSVDTSGNFNRSKLIKYEEGYSLIHSAGVKRYNLVHFTDNGISFQDTLVNENFPVFEDVLPKNANTFLAPAFSKLYEVISGSIVFHNFEGETSVLDASFLDDEVYIFGTMDSVYKYKYKTKILEKAKSLQGISLNCIYRDRENNYWIGTKKNGIYITSSLNTNYYGESNQKLASNFVYSINGNNDVVLAGQSDGYLSLFDRSQFVKTIANNEVGDLRVVEVDGDTVYFCYDHSVEIGKVSNQLDETVNNKELYLLQANKNIVVQNSKISIASAFGVHEFEKDIIPDRRSNYVENQITRIRTYGLCYDNKERLWVGSTEGLYIKEGNELEAKYIFSDSTNNFGVSSIVQSDDNSIWVAVNTKGVYRLVNDTIHSFYGKELRSHNNLVLYPDKDSLWIGSIKGLTKLDIKSSIIEHYTVSSGLPSNEVNAMYGTDEKLWIGTTKGLVSIDRGALVAQKSKPKILINEININGKVRNIEDSSILEYYQNDLEIFYTGFSYASRGNENYKYRMLGLDSSWHETQNRSVSYYGLPHGDYEFEVYAVSTDEVSSEIHSNFSFSIKQLWWKLWWVQLLFAIAALSFAYDVIQRRQANKLKLERKERDFQKRISELKMQALQSQMNPHFIFNTLNGIQDFLLSNDTDKALNSLSDFSRMISFVFENSEKKLISLHQELEFLQYYLALEKMRFEDKINVQFVVSEEIKSIKQDLFLPPLLIQPIIENAFQHGLHHKKTKSNLQINLSTSDDGKMKWEIIDDGVGRAKAKEFQAKRLKLKKDRLSSGLTIVTERVAIFHNIDLKNVEKFLRFTDLKDREGKAAGTKVEVWL